MPNSLLAIWLCSRSIAPSARPSACGGKPKACWKNRPIEIVRMMKALFFLSSCVGAVCASLLIWWDASDGTRFNRTLTDLAALQGGDMETHDIHDPWGNPYLEASRATGGFSKSFFFSCGPDGRSRNPGSDPDDIAPWTKRSEWLATIHPFHLVWSPAILSGILAVATGSAIISQRRSEKSKFRGTE